MDDDNLYVYNSDGSNNPQRFHRKPGFGRPASLPLHHPPHPHRPGQQALGPRAWHGNGTLIVFQLSGITEII